MAHTIPKALGLLAPLALLIACVGGVEPAPEAPIAPTEIVVTGQVLLPEGLQPRNVSLTATLAGAEQEVRLRMVSMDAQGRFRQPLQGELRELSLSVGIGSDLDRLGPNEMPAARSGVIDVGLIDVLDQLQNHTVTLRAVQAGSGDVVRLALCFGALPIGPRGETVSLGSAQFPELSLGSEVELLVPRNGKAIYLLVEQPRGPGRGFEWRTGLQSSFGPFDSANLPSELMIDVE